jgi:N,N'-diacetylchitobiose transport system permease protein
VLALLVLLGWPVVRDVAISFQQLGLAELVQRRTVWVGLENYREVLADPFFWTVVVRTVLFTVVNVALTMVLGLAVALLLAAVSRAVQVALSIALVLAWAVPPISATVIFQWLFDTQFGIVNWLLTRLGASYEGHSWLIEPLSFYFVATVIVVWMSVPFVAFTVYAGLTQVPDDLVEAAELDGAGSWQRFRAVVLPSIRQVLLVVGLLQIIWDLRVFTQIFVLQQAGGVTRDTNLLGTYIYRLGIGEGDFGAAAAVAMFMLVLTVLLTAPYVRLMLKREADA